MKPKYLLLTLTILLLQHINAQEYNPTAVEGAHWVIQFDEMATIQPVDGLWEYFASGDTIVNALTYKKILKRDLVVTQNGPPFEAEEEYELFGLIRDDTLNKKVYAINLQENYNYCPVNEEYLLFDFSLNVGDTISLCIHPDFFDFVIQNITTSTILGFTTQVFEGEESLYEGMGSNYGLFEDMFAPFKKNSRYVYSTFLYYYCRETPCNLFVSTEYHFETKSPKIFPNPFSYSTTLKFDYSDSNIYVLQIINQNAQLINTIENIKSGEIEIRKGKMKKGIYYYRLHTEKGIIASGKMIIN